MLNTTHRCFCITHFVPTESSLRIQIKSPIGTFKISEHDKQKKKEDEKSAAPP